MVACIREMHVQGYDVHEITDAVWDCFNGPAYWQTVRDKMKDMYPGESVKGDVEPDEGVSDDSLRHYRGLMIDLRRLEEE